MEAFRLHNIKSFIDSGNIEIKPITVLVGQNGCGKSTLLKFLATLSQTTLTSTTSPIMFCGNMVDYGSFQTIAHKNNEHIRADSIGFDITYRTNINYPLFRSKYAINNINEHVYPEILENVVLKVMLTKTNSETVIDSLCLDIKDHNILQINRTQNNDDEKNYLFSVNNIFSEGEFIKCNYKIELRHVMFSKLIPVLSDYGSVIEQVYFEYNDDMKAEYNIIKRNPAAFSAYDDDYMHPKDNKLAKKMDAYDYAMYVLSSVSSKYWKEMYALGYIGPFRLQPYRFCRDPEARALNVGVSGEYVNNLLIQDFHSKSSQLLNEVSTALHDILSIHLTVRDIGNDMYKIVVVDDDDNESDIIDTGYGISQVLPIITQVFRSMETPIYDDSQDQLQQIVCIEQPELHLHPAAQAKLASLFEAAVVNNKQMRFLIETHSEHFIEKLQVLIAKKDCPITNDMVKIYYVDKDSQGSAFVKEMELCEDGKFKNDWPSGFFDEGYLLTKELWGL